MKSRKRVFIVGETASIRTSMEKLAGVFYPGRRIQISNLYHPNCFEDVADEDIASLLFLGHSDKEKYGGYSADEFVKQMVKRFPPEKKELVNHIYLFGCEVGYIKSDGSSIAQQIADRLSRVGFSHIQVHAVTRPEEVPGDAMYVEVIKQLDKLDIGSVQEGYISAYLLDEAVAKEIAEYEKNEHSNIMAIYRIKSSRARVFLKAENPVDIMSDIKHSFIPNEHLVKRIRRIQQAPFMQLSADVERIILMLSQRRDYEIRKQNRKVVAKLEVPIGALTRIKNNPTAERVAAILQYAIEDFQILGRDKPGCNTLKLLKCLQGRDFKGAQQVIDKQNIKNLKLLEANGSFVRSKTEVETFHGLTESQQVSDSGRLRQSLWLVNARCRIENLVRDLEQEISALCNSCFSFLYRYEINTKCRKKDELNILTRSESYVELKENAERLMQDPRVMRSAKTPRTRDLLTLIVEHPERLMETAPLRRSGLR